MMKKKLFSLIALASLMVLGGCGTTDPSESGKPTNTETPTVTEKPTEKPTTTEDPTEPPVSTENPTEPPVSTENPTEPPVSTENPTDSESTGSETPVEDLVITSAADSVAFPGETIQLTSSIAETTWSSSNDEVAAVDETGLVTFLQDGDVTITATAGDKTATKELTVEPENLLGSFAEVCSLPIANKGYSEITSVRGTILSKEAENDVMIGDGTGAVISFYNGATFENYNVGDNVLITGKFYKYFNLLELDKKSEVKVSKTTKFDGSTIDKTPAELDEAGMTELSQKDEDVCGNYYTLRNVLIKAETKDYSLKVGEKSYSVKIKSVDNTFETNVFGDLTFIAEAVNTSTGAITLWVEDFSAYEVVPPTSLTLDQENAELEVGKKLKLNAIFDEQPGKNVDTSLTWTTTNEAVATVNDGLVTAVATGEATITATSTANPELSASCVVTVTEATTPTNDYFFKTNSIENGDIITLSGISLDTTYAIGINGKDFYSAIAITPETDGSIKKDTEGLVSFEVEMKSEGVFAFKEAESGKYLSFHGDSNKAYAIDAYDSTQCDLTVTFDEDMTARINLVSNTERYLQFNANNNQQRFAFYKGTQVNPFIYVL